MDLLSEDNLTKETIEAFGGVWKGEFKTLWTRLDAAVRNGLKEKTDQDFYMSITCLVCTPWLVGAVWLWCWLIG